MHVGSPQERQEVNGGTLRSHPGASGGIDCLSGGGIIYSCVLPPTVLLGLFCRAEIMEPECIMYSGYHFSALRHTEPRGHLNRRRVCVGCKHTHACSHTIS